MEESVKQHPAEALVGKEIEYSRESALQEKRVVVGTVVDWRNDFARIVDTANGTQWPSFCLKIKPSNGGRAIWTKPLPNREEPMNWPNL